MVQALVAGANTPAIQNGVKKIALGLGVVAMLGIAYVFIDKKIKAARADAAAAALGENTPKGNAVRYATMIKSSFAIWGWTNLTQFFRAINEIKSRNIPFKAVTNAYSDLYNESLINEIESELNATEYAKFNQIIYGA